MRLHGFLVLAVIAGSGAGCSDDPPAPQTKPGAPGAPGAPGKPGAKKDDKTKKLTPRAHVEDRVSCPSPEKATGPECKPEALSCDVGLYCLPIGSNFHCEPCPERDSIRHEFRERDFVLDQSRDPFQSFVVTFKGLDKNPDAILDKGTCTRTDQLVATNYSYQDLKLVGIVSQGTQRKVLMMDRGNLGWIIKRGDCVGKEKAVVKDIGTGYITFVIHANPDDKARHPDEERSIQLHPNGLQMSNPNPEDLTPPTAAPVNGPSPTAPAPAAAAPQSDSSAAKP